MANTLQILDLFLLFHGAVTGFFLFLLYGEEFFRFKEDNRIEKSIQTGFITLLLPLFFIIEVVSSYPRTEVLYLYYLVFSMPLILLSYSTSKDNLDKMIEKLNRTFGLIFAIILVIFFLRLTLYIHPQMPIKGWNSVPLPLLHTFIGASILLVLFLSLSIWFLPEWKFLLTNLSRTLNPYRSRRKLKDYSPKNRFNINTKILLLISVGGIAFSIVFPTDIIQIFIQTSLILKNTLTENPNEFYRLIEYERLVTSASILSMATLTLVYLLKTVNLFDLKDKPFQFGILVSILFILTITGFILGFYEHSLHFEHMYTCVNYIGEIEEGTHNVFENDIPFTKCLDPKNY